jgi:hypothetical protein
MAKFRTEDWRSIRAEPVDEDRVSFYRQLIEAEVRLDRVRQRLDVSEAAFDAALNPDTDDEDDLYRLTRCVELLGGRLVVRAVFPDGVVPLLGPGAQDSGPGVQDTGPGAQDSGPGAQDSGPGAQESR